MDSEYDRKFEEMKKYIPFLESMITRLENTGTGSANPRQAQLDKIRSLRDLLLDKKKRMKMDNLLKCEQVLINLYAKVEQRDTLPGIQPASEIIPPKDKEDLNAARNKLKNVTSKTLDPDTLPEIARASETEVVCTPGSKEPALFQRRPNKSSLSPIKNSSKDKSPQKSNSKRNYTRVLVSPDRSERLMSPSAGHPSDQHLYSRRSPPRTSRKYSPSHNKRERKISSKQESHTPRKSKDLNITLKVPQERLNSLNTKDIVSRILNCSDGDVDIATLRELRTQIRRELKQTGGNEDISDLILNSYKNKKDKKSQPKNKNDVEEGELSDSESETIENIYGGLVVVEKDKSKGVSSNQNKSIEQESRKIKICLVVNTDKEETSPESSKNKNATDKAKVCDITDFEMVDDNNPKPASPINIITDEEVVTPKTNSFTSPVKTNKTNSNDLVIIEDIDSEKEGNVNKNHGSGFIDMNNFDLQDNSNSTVLDDVPKNVPEPVLPVPFKVNFYKPIDSDDTETTKTPDNDEPLNKSVDQPKVLDKPKESEPEHDTSEAAVQSMSKDKSTESPEKPNETTKSSSNDSDTAITNTTSAESMTSEIPLLNEPTVHTAKKDIVSEIDILRALKNEILSETISIPVADVETPALHQPKVTKVANAQELPKKRISIENYKRKSVSSNKSSLFVKKPGITLSNKESMKQSLKLTEKEVERFNLISKIALGDSSDDDKDTELKSPDDATDFAPKSPDVDIVDDIVSPPVIIPADPVKTVVSSSVSDVDMRRLPMSPNTASPAFAPPIANQPKNDVNPDVRKPEVKRPVVPVDPRVRKEPLLPLPVAAYPNMMPSRNPITPNMTPSRAPNMTPVRAPNMTPSRVPNMTPRAPNMTPSRAPNMTPNSRPFEVTSNRPFDFDEAPRKHVYAPMFGNIQDNPVEQTPVWEPSERSPVDNPNWEMGNAERDRNSTRKWDDQNSRNSYSQRDDGPRSRYNDSNYDMVYNRSRNDRNSRDGYNRQDGPQTPSFYSRSDCPATPTPSFGRGDPPSTPSHYFGRSECPRTPSHPFGRSEPSNHSWSEAPLTPSHPFGRSEAPLTPSHPFGRSEAPLTPSHPFGRSDYSYSSPSPKYGKPQDPRLNRNYDNDSNNRRDAGPYNDRYRYNRNDPRNFVREQSVPRNEPKPYTPDQTYNRDQMSRREPSVGRSEPRDDRMYARERNQGPDNSRSYAEVCSRRNFQREPSASRSFQREPSASRSFQREPSATRYVPDPRARASSVGRNVRGENAHKLSVESHAGRAFTIDTSVNSTFQKFLDSHRSHDISFDARRQRASSVGRSLTREPSVGRAVPVSSHKMEHNNRDRFRRAQSVGRDLSNSTRVEKSFRDIKAELESYRSMDRKNHTLASKPKERREEEDEKKRRERNTNSRDPRVRRDSYEKQEKTPHLNKVHVREPIIPVKKMNYRDPRQRKEDKKKKEKSKYEHNRNRSDSRDRHSYGISNESVSKPPVISSVKNYKIPKIKRAPEEKPVEPVAEVVPKKVDVDKPSKKSGSKDLKQKSTLSQRKVDKKGKIVKKTVIASISDKKGEVENNDLSNQKEEKRVTRRSGRKNEESQSSLQSDDEVITTRTRKFKKVICESDSDEAETKTTSKTASPKKTSLTQNKNKSGQIDTETKSSVETSNKDIGPADNLDTLDSSFGLDDIELFPDNIISDPVLDNINALIADLDNDLAAPKGGATCNDLFNEISIENMLEKITSSPVKPESKRPTAESPKTITEPVKKDLFDTLLKETIPIEVDKSVIITDDKNTEVKDKEAHIPSTDFIEKQTDIINDPQSTIISQTDDKNDVEPVVSTSVNEEETTKKDQSVESEKNLEGCSTPDSTNDAEIAVKHNSEKPRDKPDSTLGKQCEMNSDISSTHDAGDKPTKENPEVLKETPSQIDSIGSLLSILQDKSKIKELLSMLGDQSSENEKIKKKLEKLSEIVSDDEDTNEEKVEEEPPKIETSSKNEVDTKPDKQEDRENLSIQKPAEAETERQNENEFDKYLESESSKLTVNDPKVVVETENKQIMVTNKTNKDKTEDLAEEIDQIEKENKDNVSGGDVNQATQTNKKPVQQQEEESNDADNSEPEDEKEVNPSKKPNFAKPGKKMVKKVPKRLKFKKGKTGKRVFDEAKRVTRSEAAGLFTKPRPKVASRELKQLHESIKEMFMSDDILNASGVRMCRLAKMVGDRKDDASISEPEPVVVLEKVKHIEGKEIAIEKPMRKKPGPKPKAKPSVTSPDDKKDTEDDKPLIKYKPGPKSKTKLLQIDKDPYEFETESLNDSKASDKALDNSSDSESDSLESSKSFGSTELLVELKKKPKRKRGGWQSGVIKPTNKKRKIEAKRAESPLHKPSPEPERKFTIPDFNCFTDKNYCFSKKNTDYSCRLCESTHSGADIVIHYKKHHPHSEIPLSRMSPEIAREAIEQCGDIDFRVISKIPTDKYTCRFCFKEFAKKRSVLESFFWHVVSMHTGEYKHLCSECINETRCPFNLDIPPPPKDVKGQLIGYICGKCNFTQISLENLKTHVIVRHNDKETEVYTINFAVMSKKTINSLVKRCSLENTSRPTRSTRSNQSYTEASDDRSEITESEPEYGRPDKATDKEARVPQRRFSFKSKISFENDDNASDMSNIANTEASLVKVEQDDDDDDNQQDSQMDEPFNEDSGARDEETEVAPSIESNQVTSDDIMNYPHFKINYTDAGNKEYICCINGNDNHYKTGLLISMKKHVQLKHSEIWDGYCFVCKVIVTTQGQHKFSECLMHYLDKHMDDFPVLEKVSEPVEKPVTPVATPEPPERAPTPKSYIINVRPLAELLVKSVEVPPALPVIENVVSLLPPTVEPPSPSPTYPVIRKESEPPKEYKYEEAQAEVMSNKHRVVLDAMMTPDKLVQVFKCAGRFCSFTTDSAEDALLHASTHQRVGGTNALLCTYCNFDSSGNHIDLVSHVFKNHGRCQFACGLCFYRAAASQLVGAHIIRVHGVTPEEGRVLKCSAAPALGESSTEGTLPRETAVPLYICKQTEPDQPGCTFRTVTHTKFWEHLTQKHEHATSFNCHMCSTTFPEATALVLHLKTHGLKLYHCTLCVFGADSEPALLAHASARHPARPPRAYIRTICGTAGNGSFKILPLVELKKTALDPEEVPPKNAKENPIREAERSIELEKLIGHMLDTAAEPAEEPDPGPTAVEVPEDSTVVDEEISNLLEETPAMATLIPVPPLLPLTAQTPPRPVTPAPPETSLAKAVTPVLKEEPIETTPEKNDSVICLDSDDEDSKHGIITLSDDETHSEPTAPSSSGLLPFKKLDNIYKCAKCNMIAKSFAGFKRHMYSCFKPGDKIQCAHCPFTANKITVYMNHFGVAHDAMAQYSCGICSRVELTMYLIKKHVKTHGVYKFIVTSETGASGDIHYVVDGKKDTPVKAKPVKRKSSGSSAATPAKMKRYGPLDVDKLPINPILDESVYCDVCEFNTKVRLNMVRHLQLHAEQQPAPNTAPVNPVPHLETNEKHFDKMVNLASSSITTRAPEKGAKETPTLIMQSDRASRYPQFVPERYRYTCGAQGCTYISVDEAMLRCHWETLHTGTNDYHCVHCPPYQQLDKSKPLTASRIIAHLSMHDIRLYACSACSYYFYRRPVLEKHVAETHKNASVIVLREEGHPVPSTPAPAAPTMDLKPWQCGLCQFKSMLRPEVVEHCSKMHQSKMQYKCAYCPFRTSAPENVTKHQTSSHPTRESEIFHFYYREGSIPLSPDGVPHWQKQRQKTGLDTVKAEADPPVTTGTILPHIQSQPVPAVNLNLVKQEIDTDDSAVLESVEDLCRVYGEFCEPNGLNYKCSLCKVVVEDSKDAMQSHLYEELKYRKWGCRLCSYKAFHQPGLKEHMWTEHRQNQEPIDLPVDVNIESWVSKQLDYQEDLIKKNREKLAQQKIQVERAVTASTSKTVESQNIAPSNHSVQVLEQNFGPLGEPNNMHFCCPKCQFKSEDEMQTQDHLESELNRIRWCCSNCPNKFASYHEAQFHCKSVHIGQNARPTEAARDPSLRSAWVAAVVRSQKQSMDCIPVLTPEDIANDDENSLLMVRYEENVPTPEEETLRRKRPASTAPDSDDEGLVIDEQARKSSIDCLHCEFTTKYNHVLETHTLRHYNLKPFTCSHCDFNNYRSVVLQHINSHHAGLNATAKKTELPNGPPTVINLSKCSKKVVPVKKVQDTALVCLVCEKLVTELVSRSHTHDGTVPMFAKRGDIVVKCCECLMLFLDVVGMQHHFTNSHPDLPINYAYYKTDHDTRGFIFCFHCNQRFTYIADLKTHHNLVHSSLKLKYTREAYEPGAGVETPRNSDEATSLQRS